MEKFVITIGRQLGSGGKEIAEKLGKKLNITVYDKKLLEVAAKESGLDTTVFENADEKESDSFFGNIIALRNSIAGTINGYGSCMQNDKLFQIQSEAMRMIAENESCITIGRCAEYVLREHPNHISIFVTADMPNRIARIMQNNGLNETKAEEFIAKADKERKAYHDYYATTLWGDAKSYDICINSSRLGIDATADYLYVYIKQRLAL